ncbi:MAG: hypothetical protein IJB94_05695 [Clostridia bacterium]|nr:hypothetical protein [Clostridia bacterium]
MRFSKGDLFHIEMRSGIYQVLDLYKSDNNGNVYYFRKVFDGKLNLKVSKAEFVHEGWMTHISNKTRERLSETLNSVNVQAILNDLTIDRMMQFGVNTRVEIFWCTMDPKSKKRLEKQLNDKTEEFINPFSLRNVIQELHNQGDLHIEPCLVYPPDGKRLYRIELGRYCDDFDEFGNECFREMRFSEIKMSRREDLL